MWLSLKALDWSEKWCFALLEFKEIKNRAAGGQCSQGQQSCEQKIPAVTGKPNYTLTSWYSCGEFISDGGSWDFRLQSVNLQKVKKIKQEMINLGSPIFGCLPSSEWKQNPLLSWIILVWTCVKEMRLWSDPHSFSWGTTCITKVVRKWDPSPYTVLIWGHPKFNTTFSISSTLSSPSTLLLTKSQSPPHALHCTAGVAAPFFSLPDLPCESCTMKLFRCPLPTHFSYLNTWSWTVDISQFLETETSHFHATQDQANSFQSCKVKCLVLI